MGCIRVTFRCSLNIQPTVTKFSVFFFSSSLLCLFLLKNWMCLQPFNVHMRTIVMHLLLKTKRWATGVFLITFSFPKKMKFEIPPAFADLHTFRSCNFIYESLDSTNSIITVKTSLFSVPPFGVSILFFFFLASFDICHIPQTTSPWVRQLWFWLI